MTKGEPTKTVVRAVKCPICENHVYSRSRHDMRHCGCGLVFIDGGFDYHRIGIRDHSVLAFRKLKELDLVIPVTKTVLYQDWNSRADEYGIIKKEDVWKYLHTEKQKETMLKNGKKQEGSQDSP